MPSARIEIKKTVIFIRAKHDRPCHRSVNRNTDMHVGQTAQSHLFEGAWIEIKQSRTLSYLYRTLTSARIEIHD